VSFADLKISDALPIIKNCDLYLGNDTGFLHIACALEVKCLALFMDSPVMAYGKYSKYISVIVPEGETEETTTHDTLGKEKISFEKVYTKTLELLN
jgi:heptosyltransferase-2